MEEVRIYRTLDDIHVRKLNLKNEIASNEKDIKRLWRGFFHKPTNVKESKMSRMLKLGTNAVDGALLGWKLYKKFKK